MKYSKKWLANEWINSKYTQANSPIVFLAKKQHKVIDIEDFSIEDNCLSARCSAKYGNYYDIRLRFKKFSPSTKESIKELILDSPALLSSILSYELPYELFELLSKNGIDLFPDKFQYSCNCSSTSEYCPHVLSLIYEVFLAFSTNPFLFFKLHDCDLFELLGYSEDIKTVDEIICDDFSFDEDGEKVFIKDMLSTNLIFLKDNPVFASFDFKGVVYEMYKSMDKYSYNLIFTYTYTDFVILGSTFQFADTSHISQSNADKFKNKWLKPAEWEDFSVNINGDYEIDGIDISDASNPFNVKHMDLALFGFLAESNYDPESLFSDNIMFLKELYDFTFHLIKKHAIVPELFQLGNGKFHIRWVPSLYNSSVRRFFNYFAAKCPDNLVTYCSKSISKKSQVLTALSLIISGYLKYFLKHADLKDLKRFTSDDYFKLFYSKSMECEIESVNDWLDTFHITERKNPVCAIINTEKNLFSFDIQVKKDGELSDTDLFKNDLNVQRDIYVINKIFKMYSNNMNISKKGTFKLDGLSYFYDNSAPIYDDIGVEVVLPDMLDNVLKPELVLSYTDEASSSLSLAEISDFNWRVAIGDEEYSLKEFRKLAKKYEGLVKLANNYVFFDTAEIDEIYENADNFSNLDTAHVMQGVLTSQFENYNIDVDKRIKKLVDDFITIEDIEVPESVNGTLRPYQEVGYSWLVQNIKTGFGSILADDMGLGKTLQVLTTIQHLKDSGQLKGQVLVVAPTSLLTNWQKEIEQFTPQLTSSIYHGKDREIDSDADILLTSYGMIRSDFEKFDDVFLLVVDEAQNIKNTSTKQTRAVKSINASHRIALSGTPVENRLEEYWSIFDFTNKGYLSGLTSFKKNFINPIESNHDKSVLDDFKKITSPFILRREKSDKDILNELPEKFVNDIYCNLTAKQTALYQDNLDISMEGIESSDGISRKGMVLKLINSLKQICNHPSHFLKITEASIEESGKMEVLISILENILDNGEKTLIFTQYVKMGEIIQKLVSKYFKTEVLFFKGSLSRSKRDMLVDEFQNGDAKIMIVSLKAGGTGLNLTAAQNVIHYDLWWNPAVENQATDRTYRIGQKNDVMVYRFITRGTFEENINNMLKQKEELASLAISSNEKFITEMTNEELKEMFNLTRF